MRHYLIFHGINSMDLGLRMSGALQKSSPLLRYDSVTIPGRSGTLTTSDGTYDTYVSQAEFSVETLDRIDQICSVFKGSGWLVSDREPDRKCKATVKNQIDFPRFIKQYHKFTVQFECQPFSYELNPQKAELTAPGTLYNQGTFESQPTITVYGNGNITVTINGNPFTIQGVSGAATVDCENLLAYSGSTLLITSGEFPVLTAGKNTIDFTGTSKIVIQPNWRWI